jgi:hypothetical protein
MPKVSPAQTSFNAGEWSPLMFGRTEIDQYKSALAVCLNAFPLVQGGWMRRPGTYFVAEAKDSTKAVRVVRFEFSTTQAYVIEFGDLYMRFYRNNGPVLLAAQNISGISQANPGVVTYAGADNYANGDVLYISGITVGPTELNNRFIKVANTFELTNMAGTNISTLAMAAWVSGGTVAEHYTVVTPYVEADLFELKFTQSADVLYVAHPSYQPRKISRTAHTAWTIDAITFKDGPYLSTPETEITLTPGAATGVTTLSTGPTRTITNCLNNGAGLIRVTSAAHGWETGQSVVQTLVTGTTEANGTWTITRINDNNYDLQGSTFTNAYVAGGEARPSMWASTDVGRRVRAKEGSVWGWATITAYTSPAVVTIAVQRTFTNTNAKASWRLGVWSDSLGWPSCVTFFEDRLVWAGSTSYPQRIDMSMTGNYEAMNPTANDGTVSAEYGVAFTLNSNDVQAIHWMSNDEKGLVVGTTSSEWIVRPSSSSEALSPTNVTAKESTYYGSANIAPVKVGKATLHVQRSGRKLRELAYVYEVDGFRSPNMTVLAEHVTQSGIKELAYQQEPHSIVWVVRNDGVLAGFTYERDQKALGWHRHKLGGYSDSGHTVHALVESACVIPSADGTRNELWLVVKRYIGGRVRRYIEYMTQAWSRDDVAAEDAIHLDCALTYDGTSTASLTGALHLTSETDVKVWANAAGQPDVTVSPVGVITLASAATVVQVGYGYNSDGQMLRLEAGAADGTAQAKTQRNHKVVFRLHDTAGIKVGASFDLTGAKKLTALPFRNTTDETGAAVPLFSGDKDDFSWDGGWTTENYVCWRMDHAGPGSVLAIYPQMQTMDR